MPRALVVGPDTERTVALRAALREAGISVDRVADALDAADAVTGREYDCVVSDESGVGDLEARLGEVDNGVAVVSAGEGEDPAAVADRAVDTATDRAFDRSLGRRRHLRELVADARAAIASATDRAGVERAVCRTLGESAHFDAAWIGRWNGSEVVPSTAAGLERESIRPVTPDTDGTAAARAAVDWSAAITSDESHVSLALPLAGGEPLGVLQVHATRPGGVPAGERERLADLAEAVAAAIDRSQETDTGGPADEDALRVLGDALAHELGNQVDAARVQLELARDREDPEHFANVEAALSRIGEVADDARALAVENLETDDCELTDVAEDAWEPLDTGTARLSVGPGTVEADPTLLVLLLENLFRNSLEHGHGSAGEEADGVVTVSVEPLEDGAFAVADDGPGIPAAERDRVFDWGYSGGTGDGTGLGIVDLVADRHGWTVDLSESEDGGARFAFR